MPEYQWVPGMELEEDEAIEEYLKNIPETPESTGNSD